MAYDYTIPVATALRLITKFGQTVTVNRISGVYSPTTGTIGSGSTSYTAIVVTVPGTAKDLDDRLKEEFVKGRVRFFFMAASGLSVVPTSGDRVEFESKEWEVAGVNPLNPAGTALIYSITTTEGGATT